MQKINLSEERSFSDVITATFSFIRQEFRPLLWSLVVIGSPLLVLDLFCRIFLFSDVTMAILTSSLTDDQNPFMLLTSKLIDGSFYLVGFFWLQLFVMSYLRVYHDKYLQGDESAITAGEVWKRMRTCMGKSAVMMMMYICIVFSGLIFFIIPGIYLSVIFLFYMAFAVIRDGSLGDSCFSASARLVKGQWWSVFGNLFILQMIVGLASYLFAMPLLVLVYMGVLLGNVPGQGSLAVGTLFAEIGQYLVLTILSVGIGVRFFSDQERIEHLSLLNEISSMGNNQPAGQSEG